jgi:hypothetical protein
MDKKGKCEKMVERMKRCFMGEGATADGRSMMRKMMECCEGEEAKEKEKDTRETE